MGVGQSTYGRRPDARAEQVEMIKVREPEPDPSVVERALQRWEGEPAVPSVIRLREVADELETLQMDLDMIDEKLADTIADGVVDAEDALLAEKAEILDKIDARLAAIPKIEQRIGPELVEYYEGRLESLEAERERAQAAVEPARADYLEKKAAADEAHQEWRGRLMEARATGEEIGDLRRKIAELKD